MIRATVIGPVWATKRIDGLPGGALLEVEELGTGRRLVALDQQGTGPGESVLVALGSGVAQYFPGKAPVDALIIGVVDERTSESPKDLGDSTSSDEREQKNEQ